MSVFQRVWVLAAILLLGACQEDSASEAPTAAASQNETASSEAEPATQASADFQVYKSPTCGCCGEWVEHLQNKGFTAAVHHPDDLDGVKRERGIEQQYQSCHTAVSEQGYVFEGHIPARDIRAFLKNPPQDAIGLAVPGMPVGSPGMEVGDRFTPYDVLLLKEDGSSEVFRHVASADQQ